ncbi:MAG TPA: hypothetical protein VHC47_12105 [Mucilaginibacter sp.]|nr:hypothetical protein [Mucilaginibacter sp.]
MLRKTILLVLILFVSRLTAFAHFDFNDNCVDAYHAIMRLKFAEARQIIQREKQADPNNKVTILLENYLDYYGLIASDCKSDYEKLKDRKSERLALLEDDNQDSSPYYLFCQAEVYLQWGLIKGRFGDYFSSALDLRKADGLLKENAKKFPTFLPDRKSLAVIQIVFGSLPSNLKSIARLVGMSGNTQTGVKQLEALRKELPDSKYSFFNNEVIFFLCQTSIDILHKENDYDELISYLQGMDDQSLLKTYLQGYIAEKTAHNDDAIKFLEAAPKSSEYAVVPEIDYLLGNARLNRMDTDAYVDLLKYVKEYRGVNYIKDAYMKTAYCFFLQDNQDKYYYYAKLARTEGYAIDEKDKEALREAGDARPDLNLLKVRVSFDGGYYDKALAILKSIKTYSLGLLRDKIIYYYYLGRVYDKTGQPNDAIVNYTQAINMGKVTSYYYAANAAFCMGRLFEQRKDNDKAAYYYQMALDMKSHEYQSSIDNDAKAGLRRVGK